MSRNDKDRTITGNSMSQPRGEYLNTSDRREPVWEAATAQAPTQQRWTMDPNDAYAYGGGNEPSRPTSGHLLRLLAMSLGLGAIAALVSIVTDHWTNEPTLLLLFPGVLAGIGATCYGIAFWWRFFQRSWGQALFWLSLSVAAKLAIFIALRS